MAKKDWVQELFLNGELKSEWESPYAATEYSNYSKKQIERCCNGEIDIYENTIWKWKYPELRDSSIQNGGEQGVF